VNEVPPIPPPKIKDRRTSLIVFGILQILLGCLCVLLTAAMVFGQAMVARTTGNPMDIRLLLPVLVIYCGLAAVFVSLGVGSMKCRRWARALTLVLAWPWLCTGLISVPIFAVLLPKMLAGSLPQGQALPPGTAAVIFTVQLIVISVLFILIPLALVLTYRGPHVKATCEIRDPVPRWTDRVPLPLLGVAIIFFVAGAMMPFFAIAYHGVMPFFGTLLSGLPGILFALILAALWIWIGLMWYQRRVVGWWALLASVLLFGISGALTFSRVDMLDWYRRMGYPESQIDLIRRQGFMTSGFMTWMASIWIGPVLGYLLWAKRFFRLAGADTEEASQPSPEAK
jgi:hypothetical protein